MILTAIANKIRSTTTLANSLGTFDYGSGSEAAIFIRAANDNAPSPRIVLNESGNNRYSTLDHRGWSTRVGIRVEGDKLETDDTLRTISWLVTTTFDECILTLNDYFDIGVYAESPQQLNAVLDFPAYIVFVDVVVLQKEEK
jgi:hypothetical protein